MIEAVKEAPRLPVFQHLTKEEINNTYNEWMKIAADNVRGGRPWARRRVRGAATQRRARQRSWGGAGGVQKINVNNTWNVALIDYFHDLSLVREGDSINFQKASCTLEGCVKVYSSRVESVSSEMAKLLSGLASANADSGA